MANLLYTIKHVLNVNCLKKSFYFILVLERKHFYIYYSKVHFNSIHSYVTAAPSYVPNQLPPHLF